MVPFKAGPAEQPETARFSLRQARTWSVADGRLCVVWNDHANTQGGNITCVAQILVLCWAVWKRSGIEQCWNFNKLTWVSKLCNFDTDWMYIVWKGQKMHLSTWQALIAWFKKYISQWAFSHYQQFQNWTWIKLQEFVLFTYTNIQSWADLARILQPKATLLGTWVDNFNLDWKLFFGGHELYQIPTVLYV